MKKGGGRVHPPYNFPALCAVFASSRRSLPAVAGGSSLPPHARRSRLRRRSKLSGTQDQRPRHVWRINHRADHLPLHPTCAGGDHQMVDNTQRRRTRYAHRSSRPRQSRLEAGHFPRSRGTLRSAASSTPASSPISTHRRYSRISGSAAPARSRCCHKRNSASIRRDSTRHGNSTCSAT